MKSLHLREKITALRARWTKEREAINRIGELKKKIEALRFEMEEQTRKGQLDRAAQIQYGELPKLESELKRWTPRNGKAGVARMLKEEVDEEDIAKIVSKWTGIPVSRMLEGEVKKLVQMEDRLRERVVGQDAALSKSSPTPFAAPAPASAIPSAPSALSSFSGPLEWARQKPRALSPSSSLTTSTPWCAST